MKKSIIIFIIMFFTTSVNNIYAQQKERSNFQLGAKISPTLSWLNSNSQDINSDGTSFKFSWGFVADFQFAEKYFFSTGFNIISTGGKIIQPDSTITYSSAELHRNITIRYIELPLSIKMKTRQFGYLSYFGQIGMGLGMRLTAKSDDDFYPTPSSNAFSKNDVKIEDQINFFRLSMILSAGVEYSLGGSTNLFGAFTFNNGFSNIFDKKNASPFIDADASSNFFDISVGIMF